jgi:putative transposase
MLAYSLLPNKFDFLLTPNTDACENIFIKGKEMHMQQLSKTIGKTLSSYTQTINGEKNRTGKLFQKKTKAKNLNAEFDPNGLSESDFLVNYMNCIHYFPVEAGFCKFPVEWEMSSAKDYAGLRNGTFCNRKLFLNLTGKRDFVTESPGFNTELIKRIY